MSEPADPKISPFPSLMRERPVEGPVEASGRSYLEAARQARIALDDLVARLRDAAERSRAVADLEALPPGPRDHARITAIQLDREIAIFEAIQSRT